MKYINIDHELNSFISSLYPQRDKIDVEMEGATAERKDRHKKVRCTVCDSYIRSDNLKRHARIHKDILNMSEDDAREELRARHAAHIKRDEQRQKVIEIARQEDIPIDQVLCNDLEEDMLQDNKDYLNKIELGKRINIIIEKGVVKEESLSRTRKEALDLYRKQIPIRNMEQVDLRAWQEQLMDAAAKPTEREVIWIQGVRGNEGKTWFQNYLASFYGHARVVRLNLKMKTANVLHALTKRPLSTTDIFLFNEPRAVNNEACNYSILESIKDGTAVSSKYNNDIVTFKVPNVVIVFSNCIPQMNQLSRDRWCIFRITKAGLKRCDGRIWEQQKTNKQSRVFLDE